MLSFWNETLKSISQDQRKDQFVFIINKIRYLIPFSYALAISPLITELYLKDPSYREFEIELNENIVDEFSNFLRGNQIKQKTFLIIGKLLKNKEMMKIWKNSIERTNESVIEIIKYFCEINDIYNDDDVKEEIQYIANHLDGMKESVQDLTEEVLLSIFRNENITINKEGTIWEIVKKRVIKMKEEINNAENDKKKREKLQNMRRLLLGNVKIQFLTKAHLNEYIQEIQIEDIADMKCNSKSTNIWSQLQALFLKNINGFNYTMKHYKTIEHQKGRDFDGIIKNLENEYGKDICQKKIVTISASSTQSSGRPEQVIDYDWNSFWNSNWKTPGEWWEINFKKRKIKMNGYSLKTGFKGKDWIHLKNWVIEGKNKGENWQEIDKQQDNYDLNGPSYQHYYSLPKKTEPFQFIRIKCIGKDHYNNSHQDNTCYYLQLNNFEIYGDISED